MGRCKSLVKKKKYKAHCNANVLSGMVTDAGGNWHENPGKAGATQSAYVNVRNGTAHQKVV